MRNDPSETGGLFIGRRPGTGPLRFRGSPHRGGQKRMRADSTLAALMLAAMVLLSLLCWGPIPLACLWVGSQIEYLTGSVGLGILLAFVALAVLLFGTLSLLRRLDHAWILVRRAAGHDQRSGALARVFATAAVVCGGAFLVWFLLIKGPIGSGSVPRVASVPAHSPPCTSIVADRAPHPASRCGL